MVKIKQVGIGRMASGTIDGIKGDSICPLTPGAFVVIEHGEIRRSHDF